MKERGKSNGDPDCNDHHYGFLGRGPDQADPASALQGNYIAGREFLIVVLLI